MKDLLVQLKKQGGKVLLVGILATGLTACGGHTIDPTMSLMPTYEMPAAVVVQSPPVAMQGHNNFGYSPISSGAHYGATQQRKNFSAHSNGYQSAPTQSMPRTLSNPDGSTVIQQSPITVQRPSIVVPQQPIWVGNPPMPIPQPPVVINQPPVVYDQPNITVRPPQVELNVHPPEVEFHHPPVRSAPMMMQPMVMQPMPTQMMNCVPAQAYMQHSNCYQQPYQQQYQHQQQPPMTMTAPSQQRMMAPSQVVPTQPRREDYLPPK
ncbi:MAG: hypothetical protein HQL72_03020 [Magnetococcales bacterium]|nr:hypothetical protein [Magnetococcales bacterium]